MGSPCGEELVLDQTGHARYDGDERRCPSFQRDVDLEHLGHYKQQQIGQLLGGVGDIRSRAIGS